MIDCVRGCDGGSEGLMVGKKNVGWIDRARYVILGPAEHIPISTTLTNTVRIITDII